jgi:ABC-type xylose transport system permease subunit
MRLLPMSSAGQPGGSEAFSLLVGALVMASLDNGMSLMNTSSYFSSS